jgi:hypothetical protein
VNAQIAVFRSIAICTIVALGIVHALVGLIFITNLEIWVLACAALLLAVEISVVVSAAGFRSPYEKAYEFISAVLSLSAGEHIP